jgi:hypothetical protein
MVTSGWPLLDFNWLTTTLSDIKTDGLSNKYLKSISFIIIRKTLGILALIQHGEFFDFN